MNHATEAARRLTEANIAAAASVSVAACRRREDRRRALALAYERVAGCVDRNVGVGGQLGEQVSQRGHSVIGG